LDALIRLPAAKQTGELGCKPVGAYIAVDPYWPVEL
jgi:hypothetical protein